MLDVVAPLLQIYVLPPLAISVVLSPKHISSSPLIDGIGKGCTVIVSLADA